MKLEVVVLPVSDVDRARDFYQKLGWRPSRPAAARQSARYSTTPAAFFHHAGAGAKVVGPAEEHKSYGSWVSFDDPDGNSWFVQEVTTRLPRLAEALRPRTASTRTRPGRRTRTGMRNTWRMSRPSRTRANEQL